MEGPINCPPRKIKVLFKGTSIVFKFDFPRSSSQNKFQVKQSAGRTQSSRDLFQYQNNLASRTDLKVKADIKERSAKTPTHKTPIRQDSKEQIRQEKIAKNTEYIEKQNADLLDLVNNKVDFFMNVVKQFMNTSSKLMKFVYAKSPEIENLLKSFKSQKTAVEETMQQLVIT